MKKRFLNAAYTTVAIVMVARMMNIHMECCFSEYPDENVLEACRKILQTVKRFVEEAKSRFN
jgi:hypothetical protein